MKYSDIWKEDDGEEYLHIEQQKTGTRIAIPLKLRLNIINLSVEDVIELSKQYHNLHNSDNILRKTNGEMLVAESLSYRFEQAREQSLGLISTEHPPSLHECRSLSERLYREQGINTMKLLGHSKQSVTDLYNNDRGLSAKEQKWKILKV